MVQISKEMSMVIIVMLMIIITVIIAIGLVTIIVARGVEQEHGAAGDSQPQIQTPQLQRQKHLLEVIGGERRGTRKHKTTGKGRS